MDRTTSDSGATKGGSISNMFIAIKSMKSAGCAPIIGGIPRHDPKRTDWGFRN